MKNTEKVKRILDAGHLVKATDEDGVAYTIYDQPEEGWVISYKIGDGELELYQINEWEDCTIEVIQRIPIPYKSGDKVLVLSNPYPGIEDKEVMVGKVCEINSFHNGYYRVWTDDKSDWFYFPSHCLSPAFDDEKILSGKEVTVVIDGKEYTAVMK